MAYGFIFFIKLKSKLRWKKINRFPFTGLTSINKLSCKNAFCTPDSSRKGPINSWMSDRKFVRPSVYLYFLRIYQSVFSEIFYYNTYPQLKKSDKNMFSEKFQFAPKWAKLVQNGPLGFSKFLKNLLLLLDLLCNESSYCFLYFNPNPISGENLIPIIRIRLQRF